MSKLKLTLIAVMFLVVILGAIFFVPRLFSESRILSPSCLADGQDKALIERAKQNFVGLKLSGAFLIAKKGEVLAQAYCGTSSPYVMRRVDNSTQFNMGSVTKQFTGYVALEAIREKKMSTSDSVSRYLPELSQTPLGRITIEQLIRMRGGIPYILPTREFLSLQLTKRIRTEEEMVQAIARQKLDFEPGERFSYSNLGYSLLGVIVGRVEQSSWAEAIRSRIFRKMGMVHSAIEGETPEPPSNLATGLLPFSFLSRTVFLALPHWNYSMIKGAGGIVSTVEDLHLWNQMLSRRAKADPVWAATYFPTGTPGDENYSYGWFFSESEIASRRIKTINHGGEDPGYCALNILIPEFESEIIVTTNSDYCAFKEGAYRTFTSDILEYLPSTPRSVN